MYKVISSGSSGNSVVYHDSIMIDCGISFEQAKPFLKNLQIILLTHAHKDHFNKNTIKQIIYSRPGIRVGCCDGWFETLQGRNIDRYNIGQLYNYGWFKVIPVKLYHDVPNCGYRIFIGDYKIFHATDTAHLEGIEAKGYDLYAIEHNYDEDTVFDKIAKMEANGEFPYQKFSINSHLSDQQASDFIYKNKKKDSKILRLHESLNK